MHIFRDVNSLKIYDAYQNAYIRRPLNLLKGG